MKLGNESDIHNGLRKAKESMDIKVEEAYNRSLAKTCAEAAVKALSSGSSSSKKVPFKPKTHITVTGNGPVSAAAGAAKAASKAATAIPTAATPSISMSTRMDVVMAAEVVAVVMGTAALPGLSLES